METRRILKLFLWAMILASCTPMVRNPVPLPTTAQYHPPAVKDYRVQPGDQLEVKFFYNPELNEQVIVRPDGRISLQLANDIMAAGLLPSDLTDLLKKRYSTEINKPEITVIVRTFTAQRVFVDGEVNKAGLVTLTDPMTVLQSISQAGGLKDTAWTRGVIIIRRTPDNKLVTMQVDLAKAINNTDISQDAILMPNDIVFVPRTTIANVDIWVDQYIRKLIPVPFGFGASF